MAAYSGEDGREMLEKVSFGQKKAKIERTPSTKSPLVRLTTAKPRPFPRRKPHFPPAVLANFGHSRKNFRLISLHERQSRNMTARIGHVFARRAR